MKKGASRVKTRTMKKGKTDARDPLGSRCSQVENAVLNAGADKRLVVVLNKIDLIPKEKNEIVEKKASNQMRKNSPRISKSSATKQDKTKSMKKQEIVPEKTKKTPKKSAGKAKTTRRNESASNQMGKNSPRISKSSATKQDKTKSMKKQEIVPEKTKKTPKKSAGKAKTTLKNENAVSMGTEEKEESQVNQKKKRSANDVSGKTNVKKPKLPTKDEEDELDDVPELEIFSCTLCDKVFAHASFLEKHIKQDHKNEVSEIPEPLTSSDGQDDLKEDEEEMPECNFCGGKFPSLEAMENHIEKFHEEDMNNQERAQQRPAEQRPAEQRPASSANLNVNCNYCNRSFRYDFSLRRHIAEKHPDMQQGGANGNAPVAVPNQANGAAPVALQPDALICTYCRREFKYRYTLNNHIARNHPNFPPPQ